MASGGGDVAMRAFVQKGRLPHVRGGCGGVLRSAWRYMDGARRWWRSCLGRAQSRRWAQGRRRGAGPARWRRRPVPTAPTATLDPYGFRRALQELGWAPVRLVMAERFVPRLRGLTFLPRRVDSGDADRGALVAHGFAMGFPRCRAVHTCFMRRLLDVAFLDARGQVIEVYQAVGPWRFLSCPGATSVLERPTPRSREPPGGLWAASGPSPSSFP